MLCVVVTAVLFGTAGDVARFAAAMGLWLLLAAMVTTLMLFLSAAFDSQAAAAGTGLGGFAALAVLSAFPITRDWSPAGLLASAAPLMRNESFALAWPLLVTAVLAAGFVALAVVVFRRKEL